MSPHAFVIAMTGGIAAGKSAVARRFQHLGVDVFDADQGAREAIAPGTPGFDAVLSAFGDGALDADGNLDRQRMRLRVFNDDLARRTLQTIVHPRVHDWLRLRIANTRGRYCLLAIPLLAETWPQYHWVDRVLVVDVPLEVQIQRLLSRDEVDRTLAERMLATQANREQRLALADDVIDNTGPESALDEQVANLHRKYLAFAPARSL